MYTYDGYYKCNCGALTVSINGTEYSCSEKNKKAYFPGLDLRRIRRYHGPTVSCNHCSGGGSGLDLCGCGSGAPFGHCDNGLPECAHPAQIL